MGLEDGGRRFTHQKLFGPGWTAEERGGGGRRGCSGRGGQEVMSRGEERRGESERGEK